MSRWALVLLAAITTACAASCPTGSSCYGRPIEREQVQTLEAGVTTALDVARSLGEPADLTILRDGSETWVYRYRSPLHRLGRPDGRRCIQVQTEAELRVAFDPRGIVRSQELATRELPES